MHSYTRDVNELVDSSLKLINQNLENPLSGLDLEKCYSEHWLLEGVVENFLKPGASKIRLPKLKSDNKLVSGDNENVSDLSDEFHLQLFAALYRHVVPTYITRIAQESSKYMQIILEWASIPYNYVAFADFCLNPTNKPGISEKLMFARRFIATHISQGLCDTLDSDDSETNREVLARNIFQSVTPEYTESSFKSAVDWERPATHTHKQFMSPSRSLQYTLLNYFESVWTTDQSNFRKLLCAPVAEFITKKRLNILDPWDFSESAEQALSEPGNLALKYFLALRAFCLLYSCHVVLDMFRSSADATNGVYSQFLSRQNDPYSERAPSFVARAFCSVSTGFLLVLQYLLKTGKIRPNTCVDPDGRSLLIAAVSAGKTDIVRCLLTEVSPPINVNAHSASGNTALHIAVCQNNRELARILIETGGASVDVTNSNSNDATPLHMAAVFGYPEMVELLIQHSADPDSRTTSDNLTAIQLAEQQHHDDLTDRMSQLTGKERHISSASVLLTKQAAFERLRMNFERSEKLRPKSAKDRGNRMNITNTAKLHKP
ncbi:unnamed protein product [Calicophoron daubneyi]|uniref:Uncharacterized protein n=1 Tax=Calicophoron daubneyi TaxID=300641 RepID=A0AAV2SYF0_CALDB